MWLHRTRFHLVLQTWIRLQTRFSWKYSQNEQWKPVRQGKQMTLDGIDPGSTKNQPESGGINSNQSYSCSSVRAMVRNDPVLLSLNSILFFSYRQNQTDSCFKCRITRILRKPPWKWNIYTTYTTFGNENIFWRHLNICQVYFKYMSDIFWQIYI